jgi:hypothetical protein
VQRKSMELGEQCVESVGITVLVINLKGIFIHGGRQLFSPTLLTKVEVSLLK